MPNIAVIYYSATGTNARVAAAVGEGAGQGGADVRVRLVPETAPPEAIESNAAWKAFHEQSRETARATLEDLEWADGVVFGTPTRFGNVAAQFKAFIDTTGGLWQAGKLANKVYAGFTSAMNPNGGQEATLLALYNSIYHFGGIIATPGYTDPLVFGNGGNPYGVSVTANGDGPTEADLAHAQLLGRRVAELSAKLRS